jgi:hypothetical protein
LYFKGLHAAAKSAGKITAAAGPDDYLCVALDDGSYAQPDPEPEEEPMTQAAVQVLIPDTLQAGGYNPDLHPRDAHGHWTSKPGGGTGKTPPRRPGRLITPAAQKDVDDAIAKAEADLERAKGDLQSQQHTEIERMLTEIRATHAQLIAEDKAETKAGRTAEERHRAKVKLVHHVIALGVVAILSFLAVRMDVSPIIGILGGYGPLFLQEAADALRKV